MADFRIEPLAEDALLLRFGDGIEFATNARVHAAARTLRDANLPGIGDIAPAYATLLLRFDPLAWADGERTQTFERIAKLLRSIVTSHPLPQPAASLGGKGRGEGACVTREQNAGNSRNPESESPPPHPTLSPEPEAVRGRGLISGVVEIPVCYGGECGSDLDVVAEHARLSHDEVIARHAAAEYTVAMLGFAPGFPYLFGLDASLHVPRRASPRTRVPAGSVAIGGAQTGIYPRELPGGWHLIGRTPLTLFDPAREPPCLLTPGDCVRFRAVDADEFERLAEHA